MQIAVLGTDADILTLVAAANRLGHAIVWLGDVRPQDATAIASLASSLTPSSDWETLLDQTAADAVLVGRGAAHPDLRAEQLKRLATDAVPILAVHPVCDSVLTYYEIDMIRRETYGVVLSYNPLSSHPAISELATWVREGHRTVGTIHQISCERRAGEAGRDGVLAALARDVELLAGVAGRIQRVSAAGPQAGDALFASLQVQLSTAGPAPLRWAIAPPSNRGVGVVLTLVGDRGTVMLHAADCADESGNSEWSLEQTRAEGRDASPLAPFDAAAAAVEQLAAAVALRDPSSRDTASTWSGATQAMEVVDAVQLSLQKGRTVDVHPQQLTEQLAFRGTMAALGCGVLLVGLAVLLLATLLGGVEAVIERKLIPSWPIALLAVLAVFLLLQAIPLLIPKRRHNPPRDDLPTTPS